MSKKDKPPAIVATSGKPAAKAKCTRKTLIRKTRYMALEQRIVFDGALAADIVDKNAATDAAQTSTAAPESTLPAVDWSQTKVPAGSADTKAATTPAERTAAEKIAEADRSAFAADSDRPFNAREIVFIDSSLWGAEQLADAARPGIEVVMLDPARDGINQIGEALAGRTGIEAIHIVSHGAPGVLWLGASELSTANISQYAPQLQAWGASLAEGADIMIYGCRAGAGEAGEQLAKGLSELTGADVGASTDVTGGSDATDANWAMEFNWGTVEAGLYGDATLLGAYGSALTNINLAGNTGWSSLLYGSRQDPGGDQQASKASTDIVGDAGHATLYFNYDNKGTATESDDEISYRFRVASADSGGAFGAKGIIGIDADLDGTIDIYVGVDDAQTSNVVLYNPGTGANISPNTSSITPAPGRSYLTTASTYKFTAVSDKPHGMVDLGFERQLRAIAPLTVKPPDKKFLVHLGEGPGYRWMINGRIHGEHVPFDVTQGERVEMTFMNPTTMMHPMHLHGHNFQVVAIGMMARRMDGAVRDTIVVPAHMPVTVAFDATHKGSWFLHCHHLYHMATGMMTEVRIA